MPAVYAGVVISAVPPGLPIANTYPNLVQAQVFTLNGITLEGTRGASFRFDGAFNNSMSDFTFVSQSVVLAETWWVHLWDGVTLASYPFTNPVTAAVFAAGQPLSFVHQGTYQDAIGNWSIWIVPGAPPADYLPVVDKFFFHLTG